MRYFWKRWRLALVAMISACALSAAFAGTALAAEPGEQGGWAHESVGGANLRTVTTLAEARDQSGNYLRVWRGALPTQNPVTGGPQADVVWASYDGGPAVRAGLTQATTYYAPAVTAIGGGGGQFMVFHTGTDGHIYYSRLSVDSGNGGSTQVWGGWTAVPDQTTNNAVSAAQLTPGGQNVYLVYHSATDNHIWGTVYNGVEDSWAHTVIIGNGAEGLGAPSVGSNGNGLMSAIIGTDRNVWVGQAVLSQDDNDVIWGNFANSNTPSNIPPTVGGNMQTGDYLVGIVNTTGVPAYGRYGPFGFPLETNWSRDITGWVTNNRETLVAIGAIFYAILTGLDGDAYNKVVWNGQ